MRWTWAARLTGAALLAVAAVLLLTGVEVRGASGGRATACGSAWDVVAGRTGWQQWWAQDLADPVPGDRLARTDRCPHAVDARTLATAAAGLAGTAALIGAAAAAGAGRGTPRRRSARLRTLGRATTVLGALLTTGGLAGLALLTADPAAPLFQYVDRAAVLLVGLLLVLPAVLLVLLGRGLVLLADLADREAVPDEAP